MKSTQPMTRTGKERLLALLLAVVAACLCGTAHAQSIIGIRASGPSVAYTGDTLVYRVEVATSRSSAPGLAVRDARLVYQPPGGMTPIDARTSLGNCTLVKPIGGVVRVLPYFDCDLGDIPRDANEQVEFRVRGAAPGATSNFSLAATDAACEISCGLKDAASVSTKVLDLPRISPTTAQVVVGRTLQFDPSGGDAPFSFTTSNSSLATIDDRATLTALRAGTVTVTVRDRNGRTATTGDIQLVGVLAMEPSSASTAVGASVQMRSAGGVAPFEWGIADSAIATVDGSGKVTGKAAGRTIVVVTDGSGQEAEGSIEVVDTLRIARHPSTLAVKATLTLEGLGGRAPYKWDSTDTGIATVDGQGVVTAVAPGTVRMRLVDSSGQQTLSEPITVFDSLSISPRSGIVVAGETLQLSAGGGISPYAWRSGDPTVASVDASGKVTGRAPGKARVFVVDATDREVAADIEVTSSLRVADHPTALAVKGSLTLRPVGGLAPYQWRSSDPAVATVDGAGAVTGVAPGTVRIRVLDSTGQNAQSEAITVFDALSITPRDGAVVVGKTLQFNTSGGITPVTWSVNDTSLASVSASGLLTARSAGQVTVSARDALGNRASSSPIELAATLRVSPTTGTIVVGQTLKLQGSGGLAPYEWRSSDASIGSVDGSGAVTAKTPGTLRVTLTDRSGQRVITDDIAVAATLTLSPRTATLVVGESLTLKIQGGAAPYRWSATDAEVANVSQNGEVSALGAGTTRIRVTDASGQSVTSDDIRIVSRLGLAPDQGTVAIGGTLQFSTRGGVAPFSWSVSDGDRARISSTGLLTANGTGTISVSVADNSGQRATSGVIRIVDSLAMSPETGLVVVGQTLQFQASGGTTPYRWRVSDTTLATMDSSGLLSAKQAGQVTVTVADAQGVEVSSEPIELAGALVVTPRSGDVGVGATLQFQVSGGSAPYQWTTSDTAVATIGPNGLLNTKAAGRVRVSVSDRSGQRATSGDIEVRAALSVSPTSLSLTVGEQAPVQASGGTPPYRWTSADSSIASVDGEGTVTARASGQTQVTLRDASDDVLNVSVSVEAAPPPPPPGSGPTNPPVETQPYRASVYTSDANAVESGSSGAFTITLDRPAEAPGLTVRYRVSNGDGAPRGDSSILAETTVGIAPLPGEVTIPTGERSATVVIEPLNNDSADGARPIVLSLLPGEGYAVAVEGAAATLLVVDDDEATPAPAANAPATLTIERIAGSATQTARVTTAMPFGVRVLDGDGNPLAGAVIAWTLSARGAAAGGQLSSEDSATDANGEARATLTTGPFASVYEVTARATLDQASNTSVSFLVNAGLVDIVDPRTPEGAVGIALDSLCPQLRSASDLDAGAQALLERCTEIYSAYSGGEDAALLGALRSLAPEEVAAQGTTGLRFGLRQLRNIDERLRSLRRGQRDLSLSGLSFNINGEVLPGSLFDAALSQDRRGGTAGDEASTPWLDERTGVFITGAVDMLEKAATTQESGFDAQTQGITAGIDRRLSERWVVGAAVGHGTTDLDLSAGGGNLDSDAYSVSGYASYAWSERTFVDGILSYGNHDYDLLRRIDYTVGGAAVQRATRGATSGSQLSGALSGTYAWNSGGMETELFGRVEHIRSNIDAYQESGAAELDLALSEQTLEATYLSVGALFSHTYSLRWGVLQPQASVSWEHESADAYTISGRFVTDPNQTGFSFQSDEPDSDYLRAALGISAIFANGVTAFVQYEDTLQRDNYDEAALSVGLRFYRAF